MRAALMILSLLIHSYTSTAQSAESLETWRVSKTRQNMAFLGGWALLNIGSGIVGMTFTEGTSYYFHQMNVGWNVVNLSIAAAGYFLTKPDTDAQPYRLVRKLSSMENSLMLNTGLDIAYITAGIALTELAKHRPMRADQFSGFGQSLILQGAFLAAFDIYQYLIINKKKNQFLTEKLCFKATPVFGSVALWF